MLRKMSTNECLSPSHNHYHHNYEAVCYVHACVVSQLLMPYAGFEHTVWCKNAAWQLVTERILVRKMCFTSFETYGVTPSYEGSWWKWGWAHIAVLSTPLLTALPNIHTVRFNNTRRLNELQTLRVDSFILKSALRASVMDILEETCCCFSSQICRSLSATANSCCVPLLLFPHFLPVMALMFALFISLSCLSVCLLAACAASHIPF